MKQNQHTPATQRLAIAGFLLAGSLLLAACGGALRKAVLLDRR